LSHENGQQLEHNATIPRTEMNQEINLFWKFFPKQWVEEVLLPETNKHLKKPILLGEFTRWIGVCLLMSTIRGCERKDFWSTKEISAFKGAPYWFGNFMKKSRFEDILWNLRLTDQPFPPFHDPFFAIRQMVSAWNQNMKYNFAPSWVSTLDESMCAWLSKYTCPGWMVVPPKPHPYDNEYHTICCGKSGIMYYVKIVKGKDHP
jgi:Transposase IS4